MSAMEDEESQKRGAIGVVINLGPKQAGFEYNAGKILRLCVYDCNGMLLLVR